MSVLRLRNYRIAPNQQIVFNGSDAYAELFSYTWPTDALTVEFWNYVSSADVQQSAAFGNRYTGGGTKRIGCFAPWSNGTLIWDRGDYNGNGRITVDYTPYLDKWTHVAVQSAGAAGSYKSIILDGLVVAESTTASDSNPEGGGIHVGKQGTYFHKGKIDELRIWKSLRTLSEIQDNRFDKIEPHADLVKYYRFDTDSLKDYSGGEGLVNTGGILEAGNNANFNY